MREPEPPPAPPAVQGPLAGAGGRCSGVQPAGEGAGSIAHAPTKPALSRLRQCPQPGPFCPPQLHRAGEKGGVAPRAEPAPMPRACCSRNNGSRVTLTSQPLPAPRHLAASTHLAQEPAASPPAEPIQHPTTGPAEQGTPGPLPVPCCGQEDEGPGGPGVRGSGLLLGAAALINKS